MGAEAITRALGGRWFGSYGVANCPAHENHRTPALSLKDGDEGRLLLHCHACCGFRDVVGALRSLGLVEGNGPAFTPDPAKEAERREAEKAERERGIARARACWSETLPIAGTLAERYLRRRAVRASLPGPLRFNVACWHGATASKIPAMVAEVRCRDEFVGIHRTYLAEPGRKAPVDPDRAMLGPLRGGAVHLSGGTGPLVVAEGIETALSLLDSLSVHQPAVWAALSTSGMAGLQLPAEPGELVIAPDDDAPGRKAGERLGERAHAAGWTIRIMEPPVGKDWNDVAREGAAA